MRKTCLITNYCYGRFLGEAINSALAQTRPFDEILVIDDGSTDNSAETVRTQFGSNPRIRLLQKDENGGQLSCFNLGVESATGDVVFFLDADDTFSKEYVEEVMTLYEAGNADFVMTGLKQFGNASEERGTGPDRDLGYTRLYSFFFEKWLGAPTSSLSCRKSVLTRFMPLPFENDWITRADDCIAFGASLCGARKYHLGKPLVQYRVHGQNNHHGRAIPPATNYRRAVAIQRLIQHIAAREGVDLATMGHLAFYEFHTKPLPTYEELRRYLRILFSSERLSLARKFRYAARMSRHWLSARNS